MKKETLKQIFKRSLTKEAMDLVFVKPEFVEKMCSQPIQPFKRLVPLTPEEQLIAVKHSFNIRVQSVALPKDHELFTLKTESKLIEWMQKKVQNIYTAHYLNHTKYDNADENLHWSNNRVQNQRFLETKKMYSNDKL